ncbi:5736_t:CDS:2 [Cetraspora pellucida]|uniref:5736_t:CDS:1 n=1 Tax=Cetraspora pellucida TaxID=1433469 RepID=A0ACA9KEP5_9GLOM|nr:5736_t:CDS:2 [Cetraspora pellucida]
MQGWQWTMIGSEKIFNGHSPLASNRNSLKIVKMTEMTKIAEVM